MNTKNNVPLMLQKSDGGYGYDSTDMAALKFCLQELGADRIIVITDFTQADHFKMCFKTAEMVGWISPSSRKIPSKVLGSPEMNSRLLLCRGTAIVMRQYFYLLGISYVNRI